MANPEHILQAKCVIEFSRRFPEQRGKLIGYFAETKNPVEGALKLSLGLVRGVSDLLYFPQKGVFVAIEMKAKGTSHNVRHLVEQAYWLLSVPTKGWFCDTEEMFFDIVGGGAGIDPAIILERLLKIKTKTVSWDEISKL